MVKLLKSLVILIFVLTRGVYSQTPIEISLDLPSEVEAGKSFIVSIKLQKGALEEFSRFQQELPVGLKAEQVSSGTADYSFEKQRIRYIWLKLPPDEQINLSYKVNVDQRLKGSFTLDGEFSYVEENERKMVNVSTDPVTIIPSPDIAVADQVDIAQFGQVLAAEQAAGQSRREITCIRQTPYLSANGNDLVVNLLVYKKDLDKFAKIEEQVPEGFEAKSMESREAIFTFQDGVAKFVWMNLPPGQGFRIAYRLVPVREMTVEGLTITGQLSYIEEGKNISIPVRQENIDLSAVDESQVEQLMARIESGEAAPGPAAGLPETLGSQGTAGAQGEQPVAGAGEREVKDEQPVSGTTRPEVKDTGGGPPERIPATLQLAVMDGIYYRIQVAAFRKLNDPGEIRGSSQLGRPLKIEYHQGLYKYTIGPFNSYNDARALRDELVENGTVRDAFVTAYRNGMRMSVPQAISLNNGR
jgi:hypothetical protein